MLGVVTFRVTAFEPSVTFVAYAYAGTMGPEGKLPPKQRKRKQSPVPVEPSTTRRSPLVTLRDNLHLNPEVLIFLSGSARSATFPGTSGATRARSRTLARCVPGGSATRATFPGTSGPTRARSLLDVFPAVQRQGRRSPARADPHGREALRLLDVPEAVRQQGRRCAARADPHRREALRVFLLRKVVCGKWCGPQTRAQPAPGNHLATHVRHPNLKQPALLGSQSATSIRYHDPRLYLSCCRQ